MCDIKTVKTLTSRFDVTIEDHRSSREGSQYCHDLFNKYDNSVFETRGGYPQHPKRYDRVLIPFL